MESPSTLFAVRKLFGILLKNAIVSLLFALLLLACSSPFSALLQQQGGGKERLLTGDPFESSTSIRSPGGSCRRSSSLRARDQQRRASVTPTGTGSSSRTLPFGWLLFAEAVVTCDCFNGIVDSFVPCKCRCTGDAMLPFCAYRATDIAKIHMAHNVSIMTRFFASLLKIKLDVYYGLPEDSDEIEYKFFLAFNDSSSELNRKYENYLTSVWFLEPSIASRMLDEWNAGSPFLRSLGFLEVDVYKPDLAKPGVASQALQLSLGNNRFFSALWVLMVLLMLAILLAEGCFCLDNDEQNCRFLTEEEEYLARLKRGEISVHQPQVQHLIPLVEEDVDIDAERAKRAREDGEGEEDGVLLFESIKTGEQCDESNAVAIEEPTDGSDGAGALEACHIQIVATPQAVVPMPAEEADTTEDDDPLSPRERASSLVVVPGTVSSNTPKPPHPEHRRTNTGSSLTDDGSVFGTSAVAGRTGSSNALGASAVELKLSQPSPVASSLSLLSPQQSSSAFAELQPSPGLSPCSSSGAFRTSQRERLKSMKTPKAEDKYFFNLPSATATGFDLQRRVSFEESSTTGGDQ